MKVLEGMVEHPSAHGMLDSVAERRVLVEPRSLAREQVDAAVTRDGAGELFLVGGFDELVDEFRREGELHPVSLFCCGGAEPYW